MYKGNYTNNKKDGYGEYFWGNGKVFKGEWKNDFKVRSSSLNQSSNERNKSSSHLDISQNEEKVKRHFKNKRSLSILPVVKKPITNTQ